MNLMVLLCIATLLTMPSIASAESRSFTVFFHQFKYSPWQFSSFKNTPWTETNRLVQRMCQTKDFEAGHITGEADIKPSNNPVCTPDVPLPDGSYGPPAFCSGDNSLEIHCSRGGMTVSDITPSDMDPVWKFSGDINDVHWAQANRTAERICTRRGYVGGHFNGHQIGSNYGLVCYRSGTERFDATPADLRRAGFMPQDKLLDSLAYDEAAALSRRICRDYGYSGGFMNGHELPGRWGVVCQGRTLQVGSDTYKPRKLPKPQ